MSKSIVVGTILAVLGLGGLAFGAWQVQQEDTPQYAEITHVETLTRVVETPREVCENVVVQLSTEAQAGQGASRDPHRVVGTAAGAIVGGLLGNQIGGGSGKKIATLAGTIGGGLAGREVQERVEARQHAQAAQSQPRTTTRQECRTVTDTRQETEAYEVTWRNGDVVQTSRLDSAPEGDRVLLEEGQPQWGATLASEG
ncbi:glycine zipper 2TM domain-containing protein [Halomonas sp. TRM85114]|uniref:glycine zipper 2TM domain-containing protein n=1 Tax=Halomonas jincaotanensis TaxID=2810616 RepID=UPI001BD3438C|nr:glycine zipper 2TM domain-containing protein [Halomonas jincaotanensis]MBS9402033.1 glycine zipper 2TM domain-containing protein [Halomonas jincaotanensis]